MASSGSAGVSGSSSVIDALSELSESASGLSSVLNTSNVTLALAFENCIIMFCHSLLLLSSSEFSFSLFFRLTFSAHSSLTFFLSQFEDDIPKVTDLPSLDSILNEASPACSSHVTIT